jgi:23S rRNA (cytidine1920-2'-O)/16S rRNA (cytidine1409-2'-O)-methyltransferase
VKKRLDTLLVERGLAESRSQAQALVLAGRVPGYEKPGQQVDESADISVDAPPPFVSRGGEKLRNALDALEVDVRGKDAVDIGASTGGFTDCLLQAGAAAVVAVDVGRGQLAWTLRNDARVTLLERTNVRGLHPDDIAGAVDVVAADLSFISLVTVAPALARCSTSHADVILLVKPQFEAGKGRVGEGGVVRDPEVHRAVLREVRDGLVAAADLVPLAVMASPLRGADGNVEFLFHCGKGAAIVADGALDACVDDAVARPGARR